MRNGTETRPASAVARIQPAGGLGAGGAAGTANSAPRPFSATKRRSGAPPGPYARANPPRSRASCMRRRNTSKGTCSTASVSVFSRAEGEIGRPARPVRQSDPAEIESLVHAAQEHLEGNLLDGERERLLPSRGWHQHRHTRGPPYRFERLRGRGRVEDRRDAPILDTDARLAGEGNGRDHGRQDEEEGADRSLTPWSVPQDRRLAA